MHQDERETGNLLARYEGRLSASDAEAIGFEVDEVKVSGGLATAITRSKRYTFNRAG